MIAYRKKWPGTLTGQRISSETLTTCQGYSILDSTRKVTEVCHFVIIVFFYLSLVCSTIGLYSNLVLLCDQVLHLVLCYVWPDEHAPIRNPQLHSGQRRQGISADHWLVAAPQTLSMLHSAIINEGYNKAYVVQESTACRTVPENVTFTMHVLRVSASTSLRYHRKAQSKHPGLHQARFNLERACTPSRECRTGQSKKGPPR